MLEIRLRETRAITTKSNVHLIFYINQYYRSFILQMIYHMYCAPAHIVSWILSDSPIHERATMYT